MPLYEYACRQCQAEFELLHKYGQAAGQQCLHCDSADIQRLTSLSGFVLKGSGWAKDRYDRKPIPKKDDNVTSVSESNTSTSSSESG